MGKGGKTVISCRRECSVEGEGEKVLIISEALGKIKVKVR